MSDLSDPHSEGDAQLSPTPFSSPEPTPDQPTGAVPEPRVEVETAAPASDESVPETQTDTAEIDTAETVPTEPESAPPPPEAAESEVTEPEAAESEVTEPEAAEPEASEAEAAEPELGEPELGEPELAKPVAAEPEPTKSVASESVSVPSLVASPQIGASAPGDAEVPAPHRPDSDSGKILGGIITAVSSDELELNLDDGRAAVISRRNFDETDTDPSSVYSVGDRAEGAVLTREDPKKRVVLSRAWALKKRAWERIAAAVESGEVLTGPITAASKRGVVVDVGVRGFVPSSHLELTPVKDLTPYVGQTFEFRVLEADLAKERLVLSRRSLLLRNQRKDVHDLLVGLEVGSVRTGTVSSLTDYGAFVDLGGMNGLVHLSELSWQRVHRPTEVVNVGDEVEVKVLDVKVKKRRVSLSMRQLRPDPFSAVEVGSVVEGSVCRLVDFGAFVDIGGAEGLVHLSELAEYRVSSPEEIVFPGEVVRAKVLSVDKKRRRIELSIRQAVSSEFD